MATVEGNIVYGEEAFQEASLVPFPEAFLEAFLEACNLDSRYSQDVLDNHPSSHDQDSLQVCYAQSGGEEHRNNRLLRLQGPAGERMDLLGGKDRHLALHNESMHPGPLEKEVHILHSLHQNTN